MANNNTTATTHKLVGFVANGNDGRGTISLLLQCLTTIFLCVYTALHFDIPVRPLSKVATFLRRLFFVTVMVVAPELLPFNALNQFFRARMLQKATKRNSNGRFELSIKQAHYLLAGGVQVKVLGEDVEVKAVEVEFLVFIDRIALAPFDCSSPNLGRYSDFWEAVKKALPPDEELDDKSKSDIVGKTVTCLQAGKSLTLILGRHFLGFEVSLLEVTTAAYIFLALVSYVFWFKKPYNIATYQTVEMPFTSKHLVMECETLNLCDLSCRPYEHLQRRAARTINPHVLVSGNLYTGSMSSHDFYCVPGEQEARCVDTISSASLIVLCVILAGIHFFAWNYRYPSQAEAWLWRASCFLIGLLPLCLIHAEIVEHWVKKSRASRRGRRAYLWYERFTSASLYGLYGTYPIARIAIIVEVFISLRAAPAGIYQQPDWTTYLGRIGA